MFNRNFLNGYFMMRIGIIAQIGIIHLPPPFASLSLFPSRISPFLLLPLSPLFLYIFFLSLTALSLLCFFSFVYLHSGARKQPSLFYFFFSICAGYKIIMCIVVFIFNFLQSLLTH